MSWFTALSNVKAKDLAKALDEVDVNIGDVGHDEMVAQFEAAKLAVLNLVKSGVLGSDKGNLYHVNLNGHANVDHKITPGWANDSITITISRAAPPEPPESVADASATAP